MARRTFQPRVDTLSLLNNGPKYDVTRSVGLYGRHSGKEQFGNVATGQQTDGQRKIAIRLGWSEEMHRTFYEDLKGISAYKVPMDMRKSYSDLYNSIVKAEIGTVLCYKVDRLFRTKNGEEWELFINACVKSNVKVITTSLPMRVYDLSLSSDADDFRQECIEARKYVESIIKGRLNAARDELGYQGLWSGGSVPVGYYVDLDDTSDTFKKFLIYEPHAALVRMLFKRYRELGGAFNRLAREVESCQPFFPAFEGLDKLPHLSLAVDEKKTGYVLGRDGLLSILTNPIYIGIYVYKDQKMYNNYPMIVDEETFFYAFDRLSKYDLDGNEKETERTRAQGYETQEKINALLRGKIISPNFTQFSISSTTRNYKLEKMSHRFCIAVMHLSVSTLDSVVSERLVERLSIWKEQLFMWKKPQNEKYIDALVAASNQAASAMLTEIETIVKEPVTTIASVDDQIPKIEARIVILRRNLNLDADEATLNAWAKELKEKVKELARLEAKQKAIAASQESQEETQELLLQVPEHWNKMKFEKKQRAVGLMIDTVSLIEESQHFLTVTIAWKLPFISEETFYIWRIDGTRHKWTDEEEMILREHYLQTPVRDMLELLPRRSWRSIKMKAIGMALQRNRGIIIDDVSEYLSIQDRHFVQAHGIDEATFDECQKFVVFESNEKINDILLFRS